MKQKFRINAAASKYEKINKKNYSLFYEAKNCVLLSRFKRGSKLLHQLMEDV
jgi:hypothetical protein